MTTYINQRIIKIIDRRDCRIKDNTIIGTEYMYKILKELSPNEIKIVLYFYSLDTKNSFAFSPLEVSKVTGANRGAVQVSIRNLIDKNYLKRIDENTYSFELH